MKLKLKKIDITRIDWCQVGVVGLGIAATIVKSIYENKRFDANLEKQYINHFEERVSKIVDKKLKK